MGRKEKQSLGRGKRFTISEVHRLNRKAKRKHPRGNLGNKSSAKEPGLGEAEGQALPAASGEGTAAGAKAQPLRPPREARPPPPNPGFADCHSGWTMPKDSTANIFFINIFLFFISGLTLIKGCGKRAPAAALPLTSALNPLPTLIEWVLRMWLCNTAISKQCFW